MKTSWNIADLRAHIRRQPGDVGNLLDAISSVDRATRIFMYHFITARDALGGIVDENDPTSMKNIEFVLGASEKQSDYSYGMLVSEANIIACINAARSVFDIFSQLVNSLVLNSAIKVESCNIYEVRKRLPNSYLKERIDELLASYWFGYVAGFINTSKHRKLVKHDFHLSLVDNVAGIQIGAFEYGGRKYPTYFAPDLLLGILEVKNQVIACGSALNIHCIQPMPNNSGSDVGK